MTITTTRVEAFSDGVIAILITLMVFRLEVPAFGKVLEGREVWQALHKMIPNFVAYLFSFITLAVLWANHHHTFHAIQKVDAPLLWLNLNFLFWTSLIPFPTSMVGAAPLLPEGAALFGGVLFMVTLSYTFMRLYAARHRLMEHGRRHTDRLMRRVNQRALTKGWISSAACLGSIPAAYVSVYLAYACLLVQLILFFIPDHVDTEEEKAESAEARTQLPLALND